MSYDELELENEIIDIFKDVGFIHLLGKDIERNDIYDPIIRDVFNDSIKRLNNIEEDILKDLVKNKLNYNKSNLVSRNKYFSNLLINGFTVSYTNASNENVNERVKFIDLEDFSNNTFNVVSQLKMQGKRFGKRPDLILYVNGLPLVVIELKNPTQENVEINDAYNQMQEYIKEIPLLFDFNQLCVLSNDVETKIGSFTSKYERFGYWRIDGGNACNMKQLMESILNPKNILKYIRDGVTYSDNNKINLSHHQYRVIDKAIDNLEKVTDSKGGIVWHTQGSGKSYTMAFLCAKIIKNKNLNNATVIVMTDRNDLDEQLFGTFQKVSKMIGTKIAQVESREDLKTQLDNLKVGGVYFTTIQKFNHDTGLLNNRDNIFILTDEAHRSNYGVGVTLDEKTEDYEPGQAQYVRNAFPNAKFVGFTGTPIANNKKDTSAIFGDYIDVYDMSESILDKSTVEIKYSSLVLKLDLNEKVLQEIDETLKQLHEEKKATSDAIEQGKRKIANLEAIIGNEKRIEKVVELTLRDFNTRISEGYKSLFVASSRKIAAKVYNEIKKQNPAFISDDINDGIVKVIVTGNQSSDIELLRNINTSKSEKKIIEKRYKDPRDKLKLVIVVDMWLTGFDNPSIDTLYLDKSIKSHNLMQTIARTNRIFENKEYGRIVDFIGVVQNLKDAMEEYTYDSKRETSIEQVDSEETLHQLLNRLDEVGTMLGKEIKWRDYAASTKPFTHMNEIANTIFEMEPHQKQNILNCMKQIKNLYPLVTLDVDKDTEKEVAFIRAITIFVKRLSNIDKINPVEIATIINAKLAHAFSDAELLNVGDLLGVDLEELNILNVEYLESLKTKPNKGLTIELLKKLLNTKIRIMKQESEIKSKEFSEEFRELLKRYNDGFITNVETLNELINIATAIKEEEDITKLLQLNKYERGYYNILEKCEEITKPGQVKKLAILIGNIVDDTVGDAPLKQNSQRYNSLSKQIKRALADIENYDKIRNEIMKQIMNRY